MATDHVWTEEALFVSKFSPFGFFQSELNVTFPLFALMKGWLVRERVKFHHEVEFVWLANFSSFVNTPALDKSALKPLVSLLDFRQDADHQCFELLSD